MSLEIREYQPADSEAILGIINDSIENTSHNYDYFPKTLEEVQQNFESKIKEGYPVLVGTLNGKVCGYATYGKFRAKPGYNRSLEHTIYLNSDAQGKGFGTELMKQLIHIAKSQGYHVMVAGMDSENTGSYRFHERLGFREVARIPEVAFKFDKWLTLVFMQLILD
ncbi:N-acetyltransferase family protein [Algoriphagus kandeliae]|uniref:N-acetyltransferase family protein n=1 Tax=Algoriphagus kandeliae TaxID=2562278 RepID=A0A4Y9QUC6_9BACT|nr:GNAT family N-acetyltransferase [Algoriphagus kandeliae]TFV96201.1 N-acetyltransferase family protein [Algoriphagus kandeliae]